MSQNENSNEIAPPVGASSDADRSSGPKVVSPMEVVHSSHLREWDPEIYRILESDHDLETARKKLFSLLVEREIVLFSVSCGLDDLERSNALNCIKILKNLISPRNEKLSGHSTLRYMVEIVRDRPGTIDQRSKALYLDFLFIALGTLGRSNIYREENLALPNYEGREGAIVRSDYLDGLAKKCMDRINSYRSGLDPEIVKGRAENRRHILDRLGAGMEEWTDYQWQQRNVFRDAESIRRMVSLSEEEVTAIDLANANGMPFGITPYYLSLDRKSVV
jgi:lysine 2,3-aminomutase